MCRVPGVQIPECVTAVENLNLTNCGPTCNSGWGGVVGSDCSQEAYRYDESSIWF